jgi:hypothetical protein
MNKKHTYAVAATLLKATSPTTSSHTDMHIWTFIEKFKAVSENEAIGLFMKQANVEFPDHNIFRRPVVVLIN